jgi:hypothetical protein
VGVTVRVRGEPGATIVHLEGPAEADLLARVGDALARLCDAEPTALVVDLSDLTLIHPRAVRALLDNLRVGPDEQPRIVCRRLSGRRVVRSLRRPGPVFASVAAAVADALRPAAVAVTGSATLLDVMTDAVVEVVARDPAPAAPVS